MKYYAVINKHGELQHISDVEKENCIELPSKKIAYQLTAHRIHNKKNTCVFHTIEERFIKTVRPTSFSFWNNTKWNTDFIEERKIKMWELGIIYSAQLNKRNPFREQAKEAFRKTQRTISRIKNPQTFNSFPTEKIFYKYLYRAIKKLVQ